jgi:hypothetical protein
LESTLGRQISDAKEIRKLWSPKCKKRGKERRWTRRRNREKLKEDSGGQMEVNLNFQAAPGCGPVTNLGREGMEPWSPVQNEGSSLTTIQHTPYGVLLVLPPPIHNAHCTLHSSESVASGRHFSSVTDAQARLIENIGCCIGCMNTPRTLLTHQVFEILTSPTSSAYTVHLNPEGLASGLSSPVAGKKGSNHSFFPLGITAPVLQKVVLQAVSMTM